MTKASRRAIRWVPSDNRQSKVQNQKWLGLWVIVSVLLVAGAVAQAQQPMTKIHRIGFLSGASLASTQGRIEAFRQGLRALGYTESENIFIEWRFADGNFDRLSSLADELIRLRVDLIVVAGGEPVAYAVKRATQTIPIVMANAFDPVTSGLVASLARPGGNITGFTTTPGPEIHGKQTEILSEAIPKLSRLGVLTNPTNSFSVLALKEIETTAKKLAISIQVVEARSADDFEGGFALLARQRAQALLQVPDPTFINQRTRLIELETKSRLPAMHSSIEYADAGALLAYGADRTDLFRRAATYVDKILKGAKPADLPVEQPTKFEFVINLKTARQIGLTIPPNVLARADKVIK
ncbi:MAG TPA: ABC transporter substrate-binding protein [Terriglobales bacterium]|nr:ABC transporter substrate-binding protein [Terriglobales bacterium]